MSFLDDDDSDLVSASASASSYFQEKLNLFKILPTPPAASPAPPTQQRKRKPKTKTLIPESTSIVPVAVAAPSNKKTLNIRVLSTAPPEQKALIDLHHRTTPRPPTVKFHFIKKHPQVLKVATPAPSKKIKLIIIKKPETSAASAVTATPLAETPCPAAATRNVSAAVFAGQGQRVAKNKLYTISPATFLRKLRNKLKLGKFIGFNLCLQGTCTNEDVIDELQ